MGMPCQLGKTVASLMCFFVLNTSLASPNFGVNMVASSPSESKTLVLDAGEKVIAFDVSPLQAEVALIIQASSGKQKLLFWKIAENTTKISNRTLTIPASLKLSAVRWHPEGDRLLLLGRKGNTQEILKTSTAAWNPKTIYRSKLRLERLVIGPRPFEMGYDEKTKKSPISHRIFFGVKNADGNYSTRTINEEGGREYAVLSAKENHFRFKKSEFPIVSQDAPSTILVPSSALPLIFHPAGSFIVWEDEKQCFHRAWYGGEHWSGEGDPAIFENKPVCGGGVSYTPNGTALIHWKEGSSGVTLFLDRGEKSRILAPEHHYLSTPLSVPDGKGLIGLTKNGGIISVNYTPVNIPLADVANAWMFLESPEDRTLFSKNKGLFRQLKNDQLYELYDSESYYCGGYDSTTPTRPYLVTTDIFFELYASAFGGIFILSERSAAIPAFWKLIDSAYAELKAEPTTKMAKAFAALIAVRDGEKDNAEAVNIMKAEGQSISSVTGIDFNFGNLKPRGHYATDVSLRTYFQASKYLMDLKLDEKDIAQLKQLSQASKQAALAWIAVYKPFIAPSKRPLIWEATSHIPSYILHPEQKEQLFPLSWGMDNEILFSTVYHSEFPASEQITGLEGPRLLPSGVDIAAALGSTSAVAILEESGEFRKYPTLRNQLIHLRQRFKAAKATNYDDLYQKWLTTLAQLWSEPLSSPGATFQKEFWSKKRLQTGLSSWASLRHTTILVNERSGSECGEGGFEPIVLQPPYGYVEPDVQTFEDIANLFDATIAVVNAQKKNWIGIPTKINGDNEDGDMKKENEAVWKGVIQRLMQSRNKVLLFRNIAKKEIAGEPLTDKEYDEIHYVGRAAEHNFLIFKSLAQKDFALSNPDPVMKVADVASAGDDYLLVGVGRPLEWDQIVPFFGRKQIVKGSVYSYYEQVSPEVMDDETWRSALNGLARPKWIESLMSKEKLSCPAKAP